MKNTINYYYNLNPDKINHIFDYYYFYIDNELYYFSIYTKDVSSISDVYKFNQELIGKGVLVNEIIDNKISSVLTFVNQVPYILTKVVVNINKPISLGEISYLSMSQISYPKGLLRDNWLNLWISKIDYLEYHHEQNFSKFPLINSSFNYFIGLGENAISYLSETLRKYKADYSDVGVISHDVILVDDTIYNLYNPENIIIDHKARDLAEYIKVSFFKDNYSIFDELDEYFRHHYFSIFGIELVIARVLWPSFYFEAYDEVMRNKITESSILKITSRVSEYERYLGDVFKYFRRFYPIEEVSWLVRNG